MQALTAVILSAMALSVMAAPTETTSAVAVASTTSAPSATVNPGSTVQFQLFNTDLCIGAPASSVGTSMTLATCGTPRTVFELPTGAPTQSTQLVLNASRTSNGPIVCVNARDIAINNAVYLDVCEDDTFEHWRVIGGAGTGPVVSSGTAANNGTYCLSTANNAEGSAITFGSCTGGLSQQWTTTALSNN